jgi:jouberin
MLVHLHDNQIKLIDLRLQTVVQRYISTSNLNYNYRSAMSPCGTFLFNSGADTRIYCWNIDSGDQVATASIELNYLKPARDIDFHPHDHMIAFCSYDTPHSLIYVFKYDSESNFILFNNLFFR